MVGVNANGNSAIPGTFAVVVNPVPVATLTSSDPNDTICVGETVTFTAGGGDLYEFFIDGSSVQGPAASNTYITSSLNDGETVTVDVTDSGTGCSSISSGITIAVNPIPSGSIDSYTDPACFGESTGTITASASGGISPYEFSIDGGSNWNGTGNFTGLAAGGYTIIVRDANLCSSSGVSITLTGPSEIALSDTTITDLDCNGDSNGSINITVAGGNGPYTFNWTTSDGSGLVSTDEDQTGLTGGTYDLTIQDSNGCTKDFSLDVNEPEALQITVTPTDITCYGEADGQASVDVTGGTGSYTYTWSDGQTAAIAVNLGPGDYAVTVTDENNCSDVAVATINEPDAILTDPEITLETCPGTNDGAISLNIEGGIGIYTILWSDGAIDESISSIGAGTYTVEITDANMCTFNDTIEVTLIAETCLRIPNLFTPNGDGKNDVWDIESIQLYHNVVIEIYTRWGKLIFRSDNGYQDPWDGTFKGKELPMDSYHYIIDLGDGSKPIVGSITIVR